MTSFENLPPDQRAVFTLLLRRRKSYDEVAAALGIARAAVHDRAHAGLAMLAPQKARALDADTRERIGEYLLGRQDDAQAAATKAELALSPAAREWARALAVELVKATAEPLPDIPAESDAVSAGPASLAISRRGGALLLASIAVVAAVAIAVILSSGGSGNNANQAASHSREGSSSAQKSTTGTQSGNSSSGTGSSGATGSTKSPKLEKAAELKPVQAGSHARGAALIATEGSKRGVYLSAEGLPATEGFSYVVWLIDRSGQITSFGRTPSVGADGKVAAVELLTVDPSQLSGIELTRETVTHPSSPGPVVLKGHFVSG